MNDIVDELRTLAVNADTVTNMALCAAADEIVRLRAELVNACSLEEAASRRLSATQVEMLKLRMELDTDE